MGRKACFTLVLLSLASGVVTYVTLVKPSTNRDLDFSKRVQVALNRGPEVLDGFQGEVHPALHGHSELIVAASWEYDRNKVVGPGFLRVPSKINDLYTGLNVSIPTKTYTERDFSRFLPERDLGAVGQTWALDLEKCAEFLKQFHPAPSMRLLGKGRRAGPDGGFAVLRAVSPSHVDILFRIHAEFDVMPNRDREQWSSLLSEAWYSPGCFLGRLVLNRQAGTVEFFWLGLPTDSQFNVHVSVANGDLGEGHGWMNVDCMELTGGKREGADGIRWVDQIETADAYNRLTKIFYKFKEIDWVAFDKVQEAARVRKKPIFAVVALGVLDNQTC